MIRSLYFLLASKCRPLENYPGLEAEPVLKLLSSNSFHILKVLIFSQKKEKMALASLNLSQSLTTSWRLRGGPFQARHGHCAQNAWWPLCCLLKPPSLKGLSGRTGLKKIGNINILCHSSQQLGPGHDLY